MSCLVMLSDAHAPGTDACVLQGSYAIFHAQGAQSGYGHHELLCHGPGPARRLLCQGIVLIVNIYNKWHFWQPVYPLVQLQ